MTQAKAIMSRSSSSAEPIGADRRHKNTARITGFLWLILAVIAPFSIIYVPSKLMVPGVAATTAGNIVASEGLFRAAMATDSVIFLIEIALSALLYVLLKPANTTLALVAAFSRLANAVIQGINLINYVFVLLLLGGAGYLTVFAPVQLQALVLLFLNAHQYVTLIWGLFFGLHLLLVGFVAYRSGYFPKILGGSLIVVGLFYLAQSFGNILLPAYKEVFTALAPLAFIEIFFPLWLLIKGVNVEQWEKPALASV